MEAEALQAGLDLEEIEIPAALLAVALPDERAGDMVVGMRVQRPMRHHDVRFDLVQPGGNRADGGRVGRELLGGVGEEFRPWRP